jgi:hypothetical protein
MKNFSDTIGNRTRDLPACSTVPQPTAQPAACPIKEYVRYKNRVKAGHKEYILYRCHISPAHFEHIAKKSHGSSSIDHAINVISKPFVWKTHGIWIT